MSDHSSIDMQLALQDPQQVFAGPEDVINHSALSKEDKVKILQHWEYDLRDVEVAEEEGMPSSDDGALMQRVLKALAELGASPGDRDTRSPTKQGNV